MQAWDGSEEGYAEHCKGPQQRYLNAFEQHLKSHDLSRAGPFVIGKNITYADFVIYQVCHDEGLTKDGRKGLKDFPRLLQLVDALEARPNIKAFLGSERYLG